MERDNIIMNKKSIKIICSVLVLVIVFSTGMLTALSTGLTQEIRATLNRGITIERNGQAQTLRDGAGNVIYPISYQGTTYVPLRAVSNIFGVPVDWDSARNTVVLGGESGGTSTEPRNLFLNVQFETNGSDSDLMRTRAITQSSELTVTGHDANQAFTAGIIINSNNYLTPGRSDSVRYINLNGARQLNFSAITEGERAHGLRVWVDGEVFLTIDMTQAQGLINRTIDIPAGASRIGFSPVVTATTPRTNTVTRVFDLTVLS